MTFLTKSFFINLTQNSDVSLKHVFQENTIKNSKCEGIWWFCPVKTISLDESAVKNFQLNVTLNSKVK